MRVSIGHDRSEVRGSKLLPAMIFAWTIVIVAIMGMVFDRQWWLLGVALAVELGVVFAGARWVLPMLSDGELTDASDTAESRATATTFASLVAGIADHRSDEHHLGHTPGLTPHVATRLRASSPEFSQTHVEKPALRTVAGE